MRVIKNWLDKKRACSPGMDYFYELKTTDAKELFDKAIKDERFPEANWVISRKLKRKGRIRYAVFAAEQVIDIYEKRYPEDSMPRKAIEAAKRCIERDSKKNRAAAYAYAYAYAYAAYADAADAADAYAYAADAAAYAAYAAADADAAADAADAAADAAYAAAKKEMYIKILNYGFKLLNSEV